MLSKISGIKCGEILFDLRIIRVVDKLSIIILSIHGGRMSNALACNARGDRFATFQKLIS